MRDATGLDQLPIVDVPPCADIDAVIEAGERRRPSDQIVRRRATANRSNTRDDERPIELVLYVSAISPHSKSALRNIRRAIAQYSHVPFTLTVHDLSKDPQRATTDRVVFTPTLVTGGQGPRTWILGHLENPQVLHEFLQSALEQVRSK
jgi:hypothetical protein